MSENNEFQISQNISLQVVLKKSSKNCWYVAELVLQRFGNVQILY
jgi:hypothetical protein